MSVFSVRPFRMLLFLVGTLTCRSEQADPPRAEFGVLYGGDIQDRAQIPLELSPEKQEIGLRLTFPTPLTEDAVVSWELERPTRQKGVDSGIAYAAELGEQRVRRGESRVDVKLRFRKGDPLGTWRIRIHLNRKLVLERPFEVTRAER